MVEENIAYIQRTQQKLMNSIFYKAFEDHYRGSRELIGTRLEVYLPFVKPLSDLYPEAGVVDLGCGQGEWLELLKNNGIPSIGVDLNEAMLLACRDRLLRVENCDALTYLKTLRDESQIIVSGFHIAEHLVFTTLLEIVSEAQRVLKPGGLLILETPNPENLAVGSSSFYLDPTHVRPLPPGLLGFLPQYFAYERVKILRLQEERSLNNKAAISLFDVLTGVSPDYAIIARKHGEESQTAVTNIAFETEYGLTLDRLAKIYDEQNNKNIQQAVDTAQNAEAKAQNAEAKAQNAEAKAQNAEAKAQNAEAKAQNAEAKAQNAELALIAIRNSTTWRLTAPLRKISTKVKALINMRQIIKLKTKVAIKQLLAHAKLYINRRPKLRQKLLNSARLRIVAKRAINRYPRLRAIACNLLDIESSRMTPRSFENLTSIKIMSAMAQSLTDTTNQDSIIFLQVNHEAK